MRSLVVLACLLLAACLRNAPTLGPRAALASPPGHTRFVLVDLRGTGASASLTCDMR